MSRNTPSAETRRSQAASEYKSAFQALWRSAQIAGVPDVLAALQRFQQAAIALSLTPASHDTTGGGVTQGWPMRAALAASAAPIALPPCPWCGGEVARKPQSTSGQQRAYCSSKCMHAATHRRLRDKRRGHAVQAMQVKAVPAETPLFNPGCEHVFVVLSGSELASHRIAAGWPPQGGCGLNRSLPHLACSKCLRTYHTLAQRAKTVRVPGPVFTIGSGPAEVHTHNGASNGTHHVQPGPVRRREQVTA